MNFGHEIIKGVTDTMSNSCQTASGYISSVKGEYFDQSHVALPNISKFFLHQALEERKAAEALMKYQQERGGHYCSKTIQVRKVLGFCHLYLQPEKNVENADPHSASTIKKQFIGPKIRKIKLMGDLLTNLLRQTCPKGGAGTRPQETQCSVTPAALHPIPSSSAESQLKI
uniref:Ferritin/DPS domain-containing protein n=1 Tax=Cyanistes caeruleus TaxID=156563 RepID=A0A8C0UKL6_CYACU